MINLQSRDVNKSVDDFMVNLIESVLIVVGILFLTMGGRSGTIIGLTLGLIMLGTFIGMKLSGIEMHIVSLGSLIVALGMLVDNAIVIVDAYLVKTAQIPAMWASCAVRCFTLSRCLCCSVGCWRLR